MVQPLDWTRGQLAEALGYLAHPAVDVRLEVQVPPIARHRFELEYARLTGELPPDPGTHGYSVLADTSDKQGVQQRIYLQRAGDPPEHLWALARNGDDPPVRGRISRNELVTAMLRAGFLFGPPRLERILPRLDSADLRDFGRGFDRASR